MYIRYLQRITVIKIETEVEVANIEEVHFLKVPALALSGKPQSQ